MRETIGSKRKEIIGQENLLLPLTILMGRDNGQRHFATPPTFKHPQSLKITKTGLRLLVNSKSRLLGNIPIGKSTSSPAKSKIFTPPQRHFANPHKNRTRLKEAHHVPQSIHCSTLKAKQPPTVLISIPYSARRRNGICRYNGGEVHSRRMWM